MGKASEPQNIRGNIIGLGLLVLCFLIVFAGCSNGLIDSDEDSESTSSDAHLAGLRISTGTLDPSFSTDTYSYTVAVDYSAESIQVTPTASHNGATIIVEGTTVVSGTASPSLPLSVGGNEIEITVTAEDEETIKIYTLTVTRSEQAAPAGLEIAGDMYIWVEYYGEHVRTECTNTTWISYFEDGSVTREQANATIVEYSNDTDTLLLSYSDGGNTFYCWLEWASIPADMLRVTEYESFTDIDSARNSDTVSLVADYYLDTAKVPPVLVLQGDDPFVMAAGDTFTDPGTIAMDWGEDEVVINATDLGGLDASTPGTYTITYSYADADGNAAEEITRTVEVGSGVTLEIQ
jgi:hypothetical protein